MDKQTDSVPHEPPTEISGASDAQSRPKPRSYTRARQASDSIPNPTRIRAPGSRKTSVTFAPLVEDLVEGSYKYQLDAGTGQEKTGRDRHRERGDRPRTKSRREPSSKREIFDLEEEALGLRVDDRYGSPVPQSRSRPGPQPYASQEHGLHRIRDQAPELEETIPNPTPRPRLRYPPAPPSFTSSYYAPSVQGLPRTRRSVPGPVFSPTSPTSPAFSATSSVRSPAFRVGRDREPMYAAGERRSHEYERIRDGREIGLSAMQERNLRSGSARIEEEREEERRARYLSAEQEGAGFDLRLGGERNESEYAPERDNGKGRKSDPGKVSLERSLAVTNPSAALETGRQATSRSAEGPETASESKNDRPPPIPTKPKSGRDHRLFSHPLQTLPRAPTPTLPSTTSIAAPEIAPEPHVDPFVVDQVLTSIPDTTPLVRTASAPAVVEETAPAAIPVDTARLEEMEDEITCPICMSIMVAVHALTTCGHTMCGGCVQEWLTDHDTCPICRTPTAKPPMVPLLPMDRMIELYVRAQGEDWEGLQGWKDRREAWEALKVVIKEEEEAQRQQTQAQASESTGEGVLDTAATANAATLGLGGWLDGEEEYRLREVESLNDNPFYTHFLQEAYSPHANGQMQMQTSPSTATSTMGWTRNFSVGDFERPRFPEPGVNPFMDAFGYTSRPAYPPRAQRAFSLPGLSGSIMGSSSGPGLGMGRRSFLDGPRGWVSDMVDLVDTFTRHNQPRDRHHPHDPHRHGQGVGDLDGLEEGMARMFAELRRGGR
ncbi:hypothetical protein FFLO_06231 [Filobasidium floriforme]|uniref:RING-type domain-containing protein n=1 Tax=Filobasidium floriforme TaxID=5210 RepID=A0A8K0NN71_9TREE|nr:hypothetical protein FFLO_06231 [Filobasidium floriforme]